MKMMNNSKGRLQPVSLYVHIPFCVRKCQYCDFLSAPCKPEEQDAYVQALIREIGVWGKKVTGREVRSIFFGGGTPSLLTPDQIRQISVAIHQAFPSFAQDLEWTLEANPGTIDREKAKAWKEIGINRISMGMQSAEDRLLKILERIHCKTDVLESLQLLKELEFSNINLDLMMGLPEQSLEDWKNTLDQAVRLGVTHLSCYSLIVEEGTPFYEAEQEGRLKIPDEETERAMYDWTLHFLSTHGFHQYEISNFAQDGFESRHNKVYWEMEEYLGIGLGASSFLDGKRLKNESDLALYTQAEDPLSLQMIEEELSQKDAMEEFMFMGLRENQGVSRKRFEMLFDTPMDKVYGEMIRKLQQDGLLDVTEDRIALSRKGLDLGNQVFASFLLD